MYPGNFQYFVIMNKSMDLFSFFFFFGQKYPNYLGENLGPWGFLGSSVVKNPRTNAGEVGLISGLGRSSREGNGNPLQYSCLGNSMDRGAW